MKRISRTKIFLFLLLLAAGIAGFAVYLNFRWKPILMTKIQETVSRSTSGLYRISFEDISTNIITGKVTISHIRFSPDTAVFNQMKADSLAPRHLYDVRVKELLIRGGGLWSAYFHKKLKIKTIVIDKPDLDVIFNDLVVKDDSVREDTRTAFQRLKPYLNSVEVGDVFFQDADFRYIDNGAVIPRVTQLKGITIKVHDVLLDSLAATDRTRLYYTKDIFAELNDFATITADSNYTVGIKQIRASTAGRYVRISGFDVLPRWGEMEFSKRFRTQRDRYTFRAGDVSLNSIDFGLLVRDRKLRSKVLLMDDARISIFLNREQPDSLRNRGLNFPGLALQRFELDVTVDTISLKNSRVDYTEYNSDIRRKGTVTFSKINGHIVNLTNNSADLTKNRFADVKATSLLMDRGRFDVDLRMDLQSPQSDFNMKAQLGELDAGMFNQVIRPLSMIEIRSGNIKKLDIAATGSTEGIKGSLVCYYNGLKVTLLEKSRGTSWLRPKGLASIYANVLIIESDNPAPNRPVRKLPFYYRRPPHSSFFNMIWKGVSAGLLGSIGFDAETQREIKLRLQRMERQRFDREERRDDRQKRKIRRRNIRHAENLPG